MIVRDRVSRLAISSWSALITSIRGFNISPDTYQLSTPSHLGDSSLIINFLEHFSTSPLSLIAAADNDVEGGEGLRMVFDTATSTQCPPLIRNTGTYRPHPASVQPFSDPIRVQT